jgi:hypothetical protein
MKNFFFSWRNNQKCLIAVSFSSSSFSAAAAVIRLHRVALRSMI